MKTEYLREFITLAETLNFTLTANKLFITQPALSKHLAAFEETLGIQLFIRTTHSVELTPEGEVIYKDAKAIIAAFDKMIKKANALSREISGKINLGILYYAIPEYVEPLVTRFHELHPNIILNTVSCQPHQVFAKLLEDDIDVGMVMRFDTPDSYGLTHIPLRSEKLSVVTTNEHPFAKRSSVLPQELQGELLVSVSVEKEWTRGIDCLLKKHGIVPCNVIEAEQTDVLPVVLNRTNGIHISPDLLRNMNNKSISITPIEADDFCIDMCLSYKEINGNLNLQLLTKAWESI